MAPGESPASKENTQRFKRQKVDWDALRERSVLPGGFGAERAEIWPTLLNVREKDYLNSSEDVSTDPERSPPHQDERQIGLDTDRSFVLYPVDPKVDRETLQAELHELLVCLFRKRPQLSYFQGFHDIVSVFYLTLAEEKRLVCVEKLSLHRLRDAMGAGLEPVLGLLRVVKNLLRLEDPAYSQVLEQSAPLPFFALSNLLTLFAHDVPSLPHIQHVFDYLLCRPPVASVYLASAVILSRKMDAVRLAEQDEEGMIHSLLSNLPKFSDTMELENGSAPEPDNSTFIQLLPDEISSPTTLPLNEPSEPIEPRTTSHNSYIPSDTTSGAAQPSNVETQQPLLDSTPIDHHNDNTSNVRWEKETGLTSQSRTYDGSSPSLDCSTQGPSIDIAVDHPEIREPDEHFSEIDPPAKPPALPSSYDELSKAQEGVMEESSIPLTDLLKHADALYAKFPPSHPGLHLSSILGPQSVVFTWSDNLSELPSDDEAEAMVRHPELVVYPYVDVAEPQEESSCTEDEPDEMEMAGLWGLRRRKGKEKSQASSSVPKRRKRKLRRSPFSQMEKKTVVAGTVLVLGVAVAIYGIKTRNESGGGISLSFINTHGPITSQMTHAQLLTFGGWAAMLSTMSQRVLGALGRQDRS